MRRGGGVPLLLAAAGSPAAGLLPTGPAAPRAGPPPTAALAPLHPGAVRLLPGTALWRAEQTNAAYLKMLAVPRLLYNFRNTSGLDLEGAEPYGGWETPHGPLGDDRGHFEGHYLSATALAVAATGDAELAANAKAMVRGLAECQAANAEVYPRFGSGYLSGFPTEYFDCLEALWRPPCRYMQVPYYNVHKIMQGLLDQWQLLGDATALRVVEAMAAYFARRVDRIIALNGTEVWERILDTESGGMNDVLYKLYGVTGNTSHLGLAHLFDKPSWFTPVEAGEDVLPGHHANTHLALQVGGAQRYIQTGDPAARNGTEFFLSTLLSRHSYATGGSSYREFWGDPAALPAAVASATDAHAGHDDQESCTTYNMLKVARHLLEWTGSSTYADAYERSLLNGVLGIQWPGRPGVMLYLLPLGVGVTKGESSRGWGNPFGTFWCCYGTAIESFSKLADSVYFEAPGGGGVPALHVALYVDTEVHFAGLRLVQRTDGVASANVTVAGGAPRRAVLRLRAPAWAGAFGAAVNGEPVPAPPGGAGWAAVDRVWSPGDVVVARFAPRVHLAALTGAAGAPQAFMYGPLLLVGLAAAGEGNALRAPRPGDVTGWVRSLPGAALRFVAEAAGRNVTLIPLNEVVDERYTAYWEVAGV